MDPQACLDMVGQSVSQLAPSVLTLLGMLVLFLCVCFWPSKKMVTQVITRDADGNIANIETVMGWAERRALHREIETSIEARRTGKEIRE